MNLENFKNELKNEILKNALKFGDFTLASGKKSTYYINCKPVTLDAKGSYLTGMCLLNIIPKECDAIGGLVIGADPMVSAVTVLSHTEKKDIKGFLVRKEPKGHGTTSQIENCPVKGSNVVIVDDVITTGGSALKAAKIAKECGLNVLKAISIVDRNQGGKEAFEDIDVCMESIFHIDELLAAASN